MTRWILTAACQADTENDAIAKFVEKVPRMLVNGYTKDGSVRVTIEPDEPNEEGEP